LEEVVNNSRINLLKDFVVPIIVGLLLFLATTGLSAAFPIIAKLLETQIQVWILVAVTICYIISTLILIQLRSRDRILEDPANRARIRLSMKNPTTKARLSLFRLGDTVMDNRIREWYSDNWLTVIEVSKRGVTTKSKNGSIEIFAPDELYTDQELKEQVEMRRTN
jgi:hypothetical protein